MVPVGLSDELGTPKAVLRGSATGDEDGCIINGDDYRLFYGSGEETEA